MQQAIYYRGKQSCGVCFRLRQQIEKVAEKEFTYDIKENTFKGFDEEIEFPAQEAVKVKIELQAEAKYVMALIAIVRMIRAKCPVQWHWMK